MPTTSSPAKVFRPVLFWLIFAIFGFFQVLGVITLIAGFDMADPRWPSRLVGSIISSSIYIAIFFALRRMKLVISAQGLEYHSFWGYIVRAQWADVTNFSETWWLRNRPTYLHLRHAQLAGPRLARQWAKFSGEAWKLYMSAFMILNFGFANTELGRAIYEHAPWVFDDRNRKDQLRLKR